MTRKVKKSAALIASFLVALTLGFWWTSRKSPESVKPVAPAREAAAAPVKPSPTATPERPAPRRGSLRDRLVAANHVETPSDNRKLEKLRPLLEEKRRRLAAQKAAPRSGVAPQVEALAQRVKETQARGEDPASLSVPGLSKVDKGGAIQVYVQTNVETADALPGLQAAGMRVELTNARARMVQGWVTAAQMPAVARVAEARRIVLPSYAHHKAGSATTQGDALLKSNLVRALGYPGPYTGAGVKVCVISDACSARATAVASGDLPPTGITMHPTIADPGDEGTAMAEIIYDMAPGAQLFGVGPGTSLEMVAGIEWAVSQGCQVICDDLGFPMDPYFEDGLIAQAAATAVRDHGCAFVSAAGNDAESHWQGQFSPLTSDLLHDFKIGTGSDDGLNFVVAAGGTVEIYMQWSEAFGAAGEDYDLFLWDTASGDPIDLGFMGRAPQDGTEPPVESIFWTNTTGEDLQLEVVVFQMDTPVEHKTLEIFVLGDTLIIDDDLVRGNSIVGHSAAQGVISVAAIDRLNPGLTTIEPYSARGPSTIRFPSAASRQTPTITAVDGVFVSGAGGFDTEFFGTSAAAPHIAAICALMLSKNPHATEPQIRTALTTSAINKGTAGFDFTYGFGLADALAAVNATPAPTGGPEIVVENSSGNFADGGTLSFNGGNLGATKSVTLTVRNTGAALLTNLAVANAVNSGEFKTSALGATSLAPGQSTTLTVTFAPSGFGTRVGSFEIVSNDSNESPFNVNLSGSGMGVSLAGTTTGKPTWRRPTERGPFVPNELSPFATAVRYDAVTFTVSTAGDYTMRSTAAGWDNYVFLYASSFNPSSQLANVLRGNDEFQYAFGGVAGLTIEDLNPGTYILVTTGYENSESGDYTLEISGPAAVTVANTPDIVVEAPAGTGLLNGAGVVNVGSVATDTAGAPVTVYVRNVGSGNLTGLSVSKAGANAGDFILGNLDATSLTPGSIAQFTVALAPQNVGARSALIRVASNDADESSFVFQVIGNGVASAGPEIALLHPGETGLANGMDSTSMGLSLVGRPTGIHWFTVRNLGSSDLTGLVLSKDGANEAEFSLGALGAATLAPGASTTFSVIFTPGGTGVRTAMLHLASNDADESPFDIPITGTGALFAMQEPARVVVGQTSMTGTSGTPSSVIAPSAFACAVSSTGVLAVAETLSRRVLLWDAVPTSNGTPANVVVGKSEFSAAGGSPVTASLTNECGGVAFTPDGQKLIVSDSGNNRVLIWNSVPTSNGTPADVVIGQASFTTATPGTSATSLRFPHGVIVTPDGKLLIADTSNSRVLIYNSVPISNGAEADVVIGQPNFTSTEFGISANRFNGQPHSVALAPDGRLLVTDSLHRVMVFDSVPTANNASATVVLGQPDFTNIPTSGVSATKFEHPLGVAVSDAGVLAISDSSNHRVVIYQSVPTANGAAADVVLGAPNFTTRGGIPGVNTATNISSPAGLCFDDTGRLLVAGELMRRVVLYFGPDTNEPEIAIERMGVDLIDGASDINLGMASQGSATTAQNFIIENRGTQDLAQVEVHLDGADADEFLVMPPSDTTLEPGESTTFSVACIPDAVGMKMAVLRVLSNDADESPFEIQLNADGVLFGAIAFETATILAREADGVVQIPIVRTGGSDGEVTVRLTTTSGVGATGAVSPADFTAKTTELVTLPHGVDSINVPITIDNLANVSEANETFTVTLGFPGGGAALGSPAVATVRIVDSIDTADPLAPVIIHPAAGVPVGIDGPSFEVKGSANDGKGVGRVKVTLNGVVVGDAVLAAEGAASTTWTRSVPAITGSNTLEVQSFDTHNKPSPIVTRSFVVMRPLLVTADPLLGSVTAGFTPNVSYREVGKSLTVTATPKPTAIFKGWTLGGGVTMQQIGVAGTALEKPTLTFIFREGLTLRANFVANPYTNPAVIGTYTGLVKASPEEPNRPNAEPDGSAPGVGTEGYFTATVMNTGAFSGKLTVDGFVLNVAGIFDHQGRARFGTARAFTQAVTRPNKPSLMVKFDIGGVLDSTAPDGKIVGQVIATEFKKSVIASVSTIHADRAHYTGLAGGMVPDAYLAVAGTTRSDGVFTVVLPQVPLGSQPDRIEDVLTEDDYPKGDGVGTLKVSKGGAVTLTATLADGTAVTAAGKLSEDLRVPLFAQLYTLKGFLSTELKLDDSQPNSDVGKAAGSEVLWNRPFIATSHYYPFGWAETIEVGVLGAKYVVTANQSVLKAANGVNLADADADGNGTLTFTDAKLESTLVKSANLSKGDVVTKVPDNDPTFTMVVNRTTGAITGVFSHTDDTKPGYNAIIFQKGPNAGAHGYFLTKQPVPIDYTGKSGGVTILGQP